jgi:hypothetical protein
MIHPDRLGTNVRKSQQTPCVSHRPDRVDNSTHPRRATAGANQTWATWPVEFGSSQQWKVSNTIPPTYLMFAELHWLWTMKCWKNDVSHDGKRTCKHEGCDGLAPEEPCQPVDVRLAVSRGGRVYTRQNSTPPLPNARCVGMCDPDARLALIPAGREGSWYSRGVWVNPWPQLTADGQELRVFFHGRNVDNRNRLDPLAYRYQHERPRQQQQQRRQQPPANPNAPVVEGVGFATFRPDGLIGLHAGYGSQNSGSVLTKPFLLGEGVKRLLLNVNSGVGGEVRVAVLDAESRVGLPGLDLDHARPLTRDSLAVSVAWAGAPECCALAEAAQAGRAVRLLITLEDAWLFSFWFE